MQERARFPEFAEKAGRYESFYLKACRPDGGQAIWIRHTVHMRPRAEPTASIWFTLFDREAEGPRATKVTVPAAELSAPSGSWIRVDGAEIAPDRASGAVETDALKASWDLAFANENEPARHYPPLLYRTPLPRTKFVSPVPATRFGGRLDVDGHEIDLGGWPGMVGHNWGSEHAERWIWLEGTGFEDDPGAYLDVGAARLKVGSWTSRWMFAGLLRLDGVTNRLGGLRHIRDTDIAESPTACDFVLPGKDTVVRGRVSAPQKDFVGWIYANPEGDEHNTVNCSVADLELTVERSGAPPRQLTLAGAAAYELGMRETDHGIPIQPYSDG